MTVSIEKADSWLISYRWEASSLRSMRASRSVLILLYSKYLRYANPPRPHTPVSTIIYPWSREICTSSQLLLIFRGANNNSLDTIVLIAKVAASVTIEITEWEGIFIWMETYTDPILLSFINYLEWVHRKTAQDHKTIHTFQTSPCRMTRKGAKLASRSRTSKRMRLGSKVSTMLWRRLRKRSLLT